MSSSTNFRPGESLAIRVDCGDYFYDVFLHYVEEDGPVFDFWNKREPMVFKNSTAERVFCWIKAAAYNFGHAMTDGQRVILIDGDHSLYFRLSPVEFRKLFWMMSPAPTGAICWQKEGF